MPRTADGSAIGVRVRSAARRSATTTSPRGTTSAAVRLSSSPTRTSPTCRCPPAAPSRCWSSCRPQIDPILYAKAYYLEPDGRAAKPYVLLRAALTRSDRVAVVKVALRQREQLATLRVRDDVLLLNTMLWPDEVRKPDFTFLDQDVAARPAELAMADSL